MHTSSQYKKGFTLVEVVLYMTFVAFFSIVAINGVMTLTRVFAEFHVTRDMNSTAVTIMDRINREIRLAYDVDQGQSSLATNPGVLFLNTTATTTDTNIEFSVDAGRVKVREGGVDAGYLGSQHVNVDILIFDIIANTYSQAIKTRLELTANFSNGDTKTRTFYSTTILRGGY